MQSKMFVAAALAGIILASFAQAQDGVITRRGTGDTSPSTRVYTKVPGVGIVGYTDAETQWINRVDQLLGEYQLENPYPAGSQQWIGYTESLVAWYQEQNPYEHGTTNWSAFNNRIIDWYLRQNPFQQGTPGFDTFAARANDFGPTQVYARPEQAVPQTQEPVAPTQPPTYEEYMQQVYTTNPYAYGTAEWNEYTNYYINEYNRLYGSTDVTADGQPLTPQTPQWQQFPQQQPWTQPPSTTPPDWTEVPFDRPPSTMGPQDGSQPPFTQPPSVLPQREQVQLPVTRPLNVPQTGTTQPRTAYPQPPSTQPMGGQPWTLPQQQGVTPMAPATPSIPGATGGAAGGGAR